MRKYLVLLALSTIFLAGCAGARGVIELNSLAYPVSMSAYLYDQNNNIVAKEQALAVVDKFTYRKTAWGILWTLVPLSDDRDIADAINEKLKETGGDGIINLSLTAEECGFNIFSTTFLLSVLPFWPGCVNVTVEGEIVRLSP